MNEPTSLRDVRAAVVTVAAVLMLRRDAMLVQLGHHAERLGVAMLGLLEVAPARQVRRLAQAAREAYDAALGLGVRHP